MVNKRTSDTSGSVKLNRSLVSDEDFAEVMLEGEWVKVEIVSRERSSDGYYLVQRVDNISDRFKVEAQRLTRLGSHDPESEYEIQKRMEFDKLNDLLKTEGCTIEEIEGDGNCLFRAVARQVYGDPKKFQKVRDEVVDHIIDHRSYFSTFDADIDGRLSQQLIDRS